MFYNREKKPVSWLNRWETTQCLLMGGYWKPNMKKTKKKVWLVYKALTEISSLFKKWNINKKETFTQQTNEAKLYLIIHVYSYFPACTTASWKTGCVCEANITTSGIFFLRDFLNFWCVIDMHQNCILKKKYIYVWYTAKIQQKTTMIICLTNKSKKIVCNYHGISMILHLIMVCLYVKSKYLYLQIYPPTYLL